MQVVCLDLEGVLVPEIWIEFARKTGIDALNKTTRDIADYNELMQYRLQILEKHNLGLGDIQAVIAQMSPMEGASDFLGSLRETFQVIILSDTFYEFAAPLMRQLNWPTLFCHRLEVTDSGKVKGYRLRQSDPKKQSVMALKGLNYRVFAAGDSYNDTSMLQAADAGFLFRAPDRVKAEFPQFQSTDDYSELRSFFDKASDSAL